MHLHVPVFGASAKAGSDAHVGFWRNPKRFNVAITRAKALLVVVGHPVVLLEVTDPATDLAVLLGGMDLADLALLRGNKSLSRGNGPGSSYLATLLGATDLAAAMWLYSLGRWPPCPIP
jgi:AAA domain